MSVIEFPKQPEIDIYSVDVASLDAEALRELMDRIQSELAQLDSHEPSPRSDAYDDWAENHEFLEDILDDVLDRLEELNG